MYNDNSSRTDRLFKTNPVIRHIVDTDARAYESGRATYRGIANKTILLMLFTLLGYVAYCVLSQRIFARMTGAEVLTLGAAGVLALVCSFVATLSVGAMEQTTAKALREAVKGGKASRDELVALGKQVFDEVKASIAPEAQRVTCWAMSR